MGEQQGGEGTGGTGEGGGEGDPPSLLGAPADGEGGEGQGAGNQTGTQGKGAQGQDGDGGQGGKEGGGDDGKEGKPAGAPESYEAFKVPDGLTIDDTMLTEYSQLAKGANLSQEQAQAMVDFGAKIAQQAVKSVLDDGNAQIAKWANDAKADAVIGGDNLKPALAAGRRAIDAFGSKELVTALNETGLGNHPELIKFFAKVGELVKEDRIVGGAGGNQSADQDLATLLYGKTSKA